jgi:hypothetical protein
MKTHTKRIVGVCGVALACYFAAYFLSVRTYNLTIHGTALLVPVYCESGNGDPTIVRAFFAPAHFLDATYLRPAHWS